MRGRLNSYFRPPTNIRPGLDRSHPAAVGTICASVVPVATGFVNLVNGQFGANSTWTNTYDKYLGNCIAIPGSTNTHQGINAIPGRSSSYGTHTFAMLVRFDAPGGYDGGISRTGSLAFQIDNAGGWFCRCGSVYITTIKPTAGESYFGICSMDVSTNKCNVLEMNLATGTIRFETGSPGVAYSNQSAGTTVTLSDSGTTGLNGALAAAMHMDSFLTESQMRQWAADPWSFWYPYQKRNFVFAPAAGGGGGIGGGKSHMALLGLG